MRLSRFFQWSIVGTMATIFFACDDAGSDAEPPLHDIDFDTVGSFVQSSGKGSFAFGAATAATQIEDQNDRTDWHYWTLPTDQGGRGEGKDFVGDAVGSFSDPNLDIERIKELGLDDYRFSIEWARVEPVRGEINEEALQHYSDFIDALIEAGVRPNITLYHFSNPVWVAGEDMTCGEEGPTDENLCGWDHPEGVEEIIDSLAQHAGLLAARFGDRVDLWNTLNEPVNYIVAAYGAGYFPPGRTLLIDSIIGGSAALGAFDELVGLFRNYTRAHVAMYDAIKANDLVDADGDGNAADVGMTLNVVEWKGSSRNQWSEAPRDLEAAKRIRYLYHHLLVDGIMNGTFDPDLTQEPSETHPEWTGKLDWLGIQYYFHAGVTGRTAIIPRLDLMICHRPFDFGACVGSDREMNKFIPTMGYEYDEVGLYNILMEFSQRYENLPMVVTEAGIATNRGRRRAENIVRTLEQIQFAIDDGADVRGYYHWSLSDNFEWHEGYGPRFGLFPVDRSTMERQPSLGAEVYKEIIRERKVSQAQREEFGGVGPMTPESAELQFD